MHRHKIRYKAHPPPHKTYARTTTNKPTVWWLQWQAAGIVPTKRARECVIINKCAHMKRAYEYKSLTAGIYHMNMVAKAVWLEV